MQYRRKTTFSSVFAVMLLALTCRGAFAATITQFYNNADPFATGASSNVTTKFDSTTAQDTQIEIYDNTGTSFVRRLYSKIPTLGAPDTYSFQYAWNGFNDGNTQLAAGTYIGKAKSGVTFTYDTKIEGSGLVMASPADIYVDDFQNFYFINKDTQIVEKMNASGTLLVKFDAGDDGCGASPLGIAADANGNIYVSDTANDRIMKYNDAGVLVNANYIAGLDNPRGLYQFNGFLYITYEPNKIVKYNLATTTASWTAKTTDDDPYDVAVGLYAGNVLIFVTVGPDNEINTFYDSTGSDYNPDDTTVNTCTTPTGIDVNIRSTTVAATHIYITCQGNHYIRKYALASLGASMNSAYNFGTGSAGSGTTETNVPMGVTLPVDGKIYVTDRNNNRIMRITDTGAALTYSSSVEPDVYNLFQPTDMAIDAKGYIYIGSSQGNFVKKFTKDGQWVATYGSSGSAKGQFDDIHGVEVWDSTGDGEADYIFIAEYRSGADGRIQCYDVANATWNDDSAGCGAIFNDAGFVINQPAGLGFDKTTNSIYATANGDPASRNIILIDVDGQTTSTKGKNATIADIAVDFNGYFVAVANDANKKFWTENAGSQALDCAGSTGPLYGVTMDKFGNAYASEEVTGSCGKFIKVGYYYGTPLDSGTVNIGQTGSFGTRGTGVGQFLSPRGLAIDPDGTFIWVADRDNNRAQKFIITYTTTAQDNLTICAAGAPVVNSVLLSDPSPTKAGQVQFSVAFSACSLKPGYVPKVWFRTALPYNVSHQIYDESVILDTGTTSGEYDAADTVVVGTPPPIGTALIAFAASEKHHQVVVNGAYDGGNNAETICKDADSDNVCDIGEPVWGSTNDIGAALVAFAANEKHPDYDGDGVFDGYFVNNEWKGVATVPSGQDGVATINVCGPSPDYTGPRDGSDTYMTACDSNWNFLIDSTAPSASVNVDNTTTTEDFTPAYGVAETNCSVRVAMTDFTCFAKDLDGDEVTDAGENIPGCALGTVPCCTVNDNLMAMTANERHPDKTGGTASAYDAAEAVIWDSPTAGSPGYYDPGIDRIHLCNGATTCAEPTTTGTCTAPCTAPISGEQLYTFLSTEKVAMKSYQDVTTDAFSANYFANNLLLPDPLGYKYLAARAMDSAGNVGAWMSPRLRMRKISTPPGTAEFIPTTYDADETLYANNTWTIRYTTSGTLSGCNCGAEDCYVTIDVPPDWTSPSSLSGTPGEIDISASPDTDLCAPPYEISGQQIKVLIDFMSAGEYFDLTYGYTGNGGSGATIGLAADVGTEEFVVQSCELCASPEPVLNNPSLTVHAVPVKVDNIPHFVTGEKTVIYDNEQNVNVETLEWSNPNVNPNTTKVIGLRFKMVTAGTGAPYTPGQIVSRVVLKDGASNVIVEDTTIETTGDTITLEGLNGNPITVNYGANNGIEVYMDFKCLSTSCVPDLGITSLKFLIDAQSAVDSSTATSLTETVLTDNTKNWTTNQWSGYTLIPDTGNPTRNYVITSNTPTTLTVTTGDTMRTDGAPASGSSYAIGFENGDITANSTDIVVETSMKVTSEKSQSTFYPDYPVATAEMSSGAITQFRPPIIPKYLYVSHDNTTWPNYSNQKLSRGQTGTEPFKLKFRLLDSYLTTDSGTDDEVDVADSTVFAVNEYVVIGDNNSMSSDSSTYNLREVTALVDADTIRVDSILTKNFTTANKAYVVRRDAKNYLVGLDIKVTGDGQNLPDPAPNGIVSRKILQGYVDTTDIESTGTAISFDQYLNSVTGVPIKVDAVTFPLELDFKVDILCSGTPSAPSACPTGSLETKTQFSIPATSYVTLSDTTTTIIPSPWTSLVSSEATIQQQGWVTVTSVDRTSPDSCPSSIGIGEIFTVDVVMANAAAVSPYERASARLYASSSDLKFICSSGSCTPGQDYTSEFTVTPVTSGFNTTIMGNATGSLQYNVVQSAASPTPGVYTIDTVYTGTVSTNKPETRDANDFYDTNKLYVNRETDGAATKPCGLTTVASPAYVTAWGVSPGSYPAATSNIQIIRFSVTDGPDAPVGWEVRQVKIKSGNTADGDVAAGGVKLWADRDDNLTFDSVADGPALSSTSFAGGEAVFNGWATGTEAQAMANPTKYYFITYNLNTAVTDGDAIDAYIPINGVALYNAAYNGGTPLYLPGSDQNSAGTSYVDVDATKITMLPDGSTACVGGEKTIYAYAYDDYNNLDTDSTEYITITLTDGVPPGTAGTAKLTTTTSLTNTTFLPGPDPDYTILKGNLSAGVGDVTFVETEMDSVTLTPTSSLPGSDSSTSVGGNVCLSSRVITNTTYAAGATKAQILKFRVTNGLADSIRLEGITVWNTGTASDAMISAVKLFHTDTSDANLIQSSTFSGGVLTFAPNYTMAPFVIKDFYVTFDIATTGLTDDATLNTHIHTNGLTYRNLTTMGTADLDIVETDSTGNSSVDISANTVRLLPPASKTSMTANCSATDTVYVSSLTWLSDLTQVTIGDDSGSEVMTVSQVMPWANAIKFTANVTKNYQSAANGYVSNVTGNLKDLRIRVEDTYGNVAVINPEGNSEVFSIATVTPSYVDDSTFVLPASCSSGSFSPGGNAASGCLASGYATNTIGYSGCAPQTFVITPNSTLSKYDGREYSASIDFPGDITSDTRGPDVASISFAAGMTCAGTPFPKIDTISGTDDCSGIEFMRFACGGSSTEFNPALNNWVNIGVATTSVDVCCNCPGDPDDIGCGFNITTGAVCGGGFAADGSCTDGWMANPTSGCTLTGPDAIFVQFKDRRGNVTSVPIATSSIALTLDLTPPDISSWNFTSDNPLFFYGGPSDGGICNDANAIDGNPATLSSNCPLWYNNLTSEGASQSVTIQVTYDEDGSTPTFRTTAAFGEPVQSVSAAKGLGITSSLDFMIDSDAVDAPAATTTITFEVYDACGGAATEAFSFYKDNSDPTNSGLSAYDTAGKAVTLSQWTWYNYANPYFEWATSTDQQPGAALLDNAGLRSYLYLLTATGAAAPDHYSTGTNHTATATLTSGYTYYFKQRSYDNVNNYNSSTDTIFVYRYDSTPPDNPAVTGYDTGAKAVTLTSGNWYNYANPYFEWAGATDLPAAPGNSGFKQYNLYFGDDPVGVPSYVTALTATTTTVPLVCGTQYYLRMSSEDNVGNATGTTTQFTYIYDGSAPTITYNSPTAGGVTPWYSADPGAVTDIDLTWGGCAPLTSFDYRIVGASPWLNIFSGSQVVDYTTDWTVSWAQAVEGRNQISVSGHDLAGNGATHTYVSTVSGFLFRKDVSAPSDLTTPALAWDTSAKASALTSGNTYDYANPYFEWTAPDDNPLGVNGTDNAGTAYYYVGFSTDQNFNPTATQTATSFTATPTVCGSSYYLVIKAADAATPAANVAATTTKMFTYVYDGAAPTITNNQTGDDTWYNADPGNIFNVDFTAGSCANLDYIQYTAYSGALGTGTMVKDWTTFVGPGYGAGAYSANWKPDFASMAEGKNYISVRVYDTSGKVSYSTDVFYFRKDTSPPDIASIAINGWDTAAKTNALTNDPAAYWNFPTPYFEWAAINDLPAGPAESSGLYRYYTYFGTNDSYNPDIPVATAALITYTATQPTGVEAPTDYYLIVKARDVAGNTSTRTIYYYNFDKSAPTQPATVDLWEDNTKPLPQLASGTWYNFPQPYVEWSAAADVGDAGLNGYYVVFATDSSYFSTAAANFTTAIAYDTAASGPVLVSCEKYKAFMKTRDNTRFGGNFSNLFTLTDSEYWYDGAAPTFTYNAPAAGGNTSWYSQDPGNVINIDLNWGGCGAPLSQYDYKIGAGAWTTFWPGSQSSNYTTNWSPAWASLAEGNNQIGIAGYDSATNGATDTYAAGVTGFLYRKDVSAPNNPAPLALGWDTDAKATALTSGNPYLYSNPYFEWTQPTDNPAGVEGSDNAGFSLYYVGFSTDSNYDPTATQTLAKYYATPTTCGATYTLVIKAADAAVPPNVAATTSKMFTYRFDGVTAIQDFQSGDNTWRNADPGAIYNVDFFSTCDFINYAQYTIWSGPTQTGTQLKAWTNIVGPGYNNGSYAANWSVDWGAATEGLNYVSAKMVTVGMQTIYATDAFYVRKDTIKPSISTGAFGEASNYFWISPANSKMYYGTGMGAAEAFTIDGTATDTTTGWLASGLATSTFSFAFDDTPADDTTPAVWSGAYDIEASNTGGATITVTMYDLAGNFSTAAYYAVNSNALSIEYATISQDWRPSYVVFNLYYPDGVTELTASAPIGILPNWAYLYNTFNTDVTLFFDVETLEYNRASCEQASGANAWCLITIANKCRAAADDPHHIGFAGTSTYGGFIATLAEELSTAGDLTAPDGDFLATCGPDYMVVKPEEDGLVTADITMANWCAGGACTPACAANYCSVTTSTLTAKPDYVKYDSGVIDQTFTNIADDTAPITEEWSWDTANKRIMLFDDPSAAAVTYTPNNGSELVCIYLKDKCDQTIVIGRWEDVDIQLDMSDAPNSGKDIIANVPGAAQGYNVITTPAAGDFTPPDQLQVKGTLKAGMACIRVTAESLPSDTPATPIRIDATYYDKTTGLPVVLDQTGGNNQPALVEIRGGAGVASGTTTFAGVSEIETIWTPDPNDYTLTITMNPVWDNGGDTVGFISRQGNPCGGAAATGDTPYDNFNIYIRKHDGGNPVSWNECLRLTKNTTDGVFSYGPLPASEIAFTPDSTKVVFAGTDLMGSGVSKLYWVDAQGAFAGAATGTQANFVVADPTAIVDTLTIDAGAGDTVINVGFPAAFTIGKDILVSEKNFLTGVYEKGESARITATDAGAGTITVSAPLSQAYSAFTATTIGTIEYPVPLAGLGQMLVPGNDQTIWIDPAWSASDAAVGCTAPPDPSADDYGDAFLVVRWATPTGFGDYTGTPPGYVDEGNSNANIIMFWGNKNAGGMYAQGTSKIMKITDFSGNTLYPLKPKWSPDCGKIAFLAWDVSAGTSPSRTSVYVINLTDSRAGWATATLPITTLTDAGVYKVYDYAASNMPAYFPSWSADGKLVGYSVDRTNTLDLGQMFADNDSFVNTLFGTVDFNQYLEYIEDQPATLGGMIAPQIVGAATATVGTRNEFGMAQCPGMLTGSSCPNGPNYPWTFVSQTTGGSGDLRVLTLDNVSNVSADGGLLFLDGIVTAVFPPGVISSDTVFWNTWPTQYCTGAAPAQGAGGGAGNCPVEPSGEYIVNAGEAREFFPDGTNFSDYVRLVFHYCDNDDDGFVDNGTEGTQIAGFTFNGVTCRIAGADTATGTIDVDSLAVYNWDDTAAQWVKLEGTVDKTSKTITVYSTHFSRYDTFGFRVGGAPQVVIPLQLGNVHTYPNPWYTTQGMPLKFAADTAAGDGSILVDIKVYDIRGSHVATIQNVVVGGGAGGYGSENNAVTLANWTPANFAGTPLASGVYLYYLHSTDLTNGTVVDVTGKLSVIH